MEEIPVKENILKESEAMFLKYGFKSITMDDVARELGISKKTLYQHFSDKNDLVNQCVENHIACMNSRCDHIMIENENAIATMIGITEYVGKTLRALNPSALFDLKKYFKPAWDKLEKNRSSYIYENIKKNIELGQRKGLYRKDFDINIVCEIYVYLFGMLINPDNANPNIETRQLHLEMIKYHLRSICSQKGLEILDEQLKHLNKK